MVMINKSLLWKFTLAFLLVAIITAALVAIFIRITSVNRLTMLIQEQQRSDLHTALANYYAENGSWKGISENWQQITRPRTVSTAFPPSNNATYGQEPPPSDGPSKDRRSFFGLADAQGTVVIANNPQEYPVGAALPEKTLKNGVPVTVDGAQVGTIQIGRASCRERV
jgi:hypothetical protein